MKAKSAPKPRISNELLKYLQDMWPDKAPEPDATMRDVWMAVGAVSVVRHFQHLHKQQQENDLTASPLEK